MMIIPDEEWICICSSATSAPVCIFHITCPHSAYMLTPRAKQLSKGVTRFTVKWSVRLTGYARDTCHTEKNLLTWFSTLPAYTMDPDDPHTYSPGYPPIDPWYLQHIENLFKFHVATMVETFKSQLDAERLGWLILLQTEIDGSCQTKVSVPVNTLKFQSLLRGTTTCLLSVN